MLSVSALLHFPKTRLPAATGQLFSSTRFRTDPDGTIFHSATEGRTVEHPALTLTSVLAGQVLHKTSDGSACLAHLEIALPGLTPDLYVEPSAGAGAFLTQMPEPRLGIDIAPAATDILKQDFLEWLPTLGTGSIAVIGNPPYGAGGAEAVEFFNHAAKFADTITLILPASFMKASNQKRLDSFFHLVSELPLPDEPFLFEGRFHRRCCISLTPEDSLRESMRLHGLHEQTISRPLSHDELVQLQRIASEAGFPADLGRQGDNLARAA